MAYGEALANRIREALAGERRVDEIKMMGGLCFMIRGHMALAIVGDELMIRVGPDGYERALGRVHARGRRLDQPQRRARNPLLIDVQSR
jgi:hypothetical protein